MNVSLENYLAYMARVKAHGARTTTVTMPCCGKPLEMRLAGKGETWDSLMTCPHCGGDCFHVTTDSTVTVEVV